MKRWGRLHPSLTLADIYGPGHVYTARAPERTAIWIAPDRDDFTTGIALTVAGSLPIICHESVSTPAVLDLLHDAGVPCDGPHRRYEDANGYRRHIQEISRQGERLVMKHVHPLDEVPSDACWMDSQLLGYLNNKGNLAALVPTEAVPARRLVPIREILDLAERDISKPVVLKIPSDLPSGGGSAVALCRSSDELRQKLTQLGGLSAVIVEEFLTIARNMCLNYTTHQNQIKFLAAADQIVDAAGAYQGNWLKPVQPPAEAIAIGLVIMEKAVALGYRGVAGFDMAVLPDGRIKVLDLNFRLNGSTPALLFQDALSEALGSVWEGRLATWQNSGCFKAFVEAARTANRAGWLLPLAVWDAQNRGGRARLRGVLLGATRAEIEARNSQLAGLGLHRADPAPIVGRSRLAA